MSTKTGTTRWEQRRGKGAVDKRHARKAKRPKLVHQFLVVLSGTDPLVWRRIQVPEKYSFWDLHVAIQDAMGWLDYHLHEFRLLDAAERNVVSIASFPFVLRGASAVVSSPAEPRRSHGLETRVTLRPGETTQ